ncbi:MAG: cell wall hydrolase, partial [Nanoarchaeota archaeon]
GKGKSHLLNPLDYLHFTGTKPSMNSSVKYHPLSASVEDKVDQEDILRDCAKIKSTYGRISPENLIYLARLVYFEAGTDGKVTSPNYQKGLDAVIHVMLNRKEFDTQYKVTAEEPVKGKKGKRKWKSVVVTENKTHERRFAEDGHLLDVVKGEGAQQFTAVDKNAPYFEPSSFKDKNGRYSLVFGEALSSDPDLQGRMVHSYRAAVSALEGKSRDPTKGALYYRNPGKAQTDFPKDEATAFTQVIPKHKVGESLEERTEFDYVLSKGVTIGSHVFYTVKVVEKTTRYDNSKGTTTYKERK